LQVSLDEPAVRHALITLSTLYERDCYGEDALLPTPNSQRNFALESYNEAIQHLVAKMKDSDYVRVPLMTCIIFICVDCLRRDIPVALKHLEGGLKWLTMWKVRHQDPGRRTTPLEFSEYEFIEEILVSMLAWLNMVAASYNHLSFRVNHLSIDLNRRIHEIEIFHAWSKSIPRS